MTLRYTDERQHAPGCEWPRPEAALLVSWAAALVMRHYRSTGDWRHGDGGTIGEPLAGVDRLGACVEESS